MKMYKYPSLVKPSPLAAVHPIEDDRNVLDDTEFHHEAHHSASCTRGKNILFILIFSKLPKYHQDAVAEWLACSTHDLMIAGSRLTAATQ